MTQLTRWPLMIPTFVISALLTPTCGEIYTPPISYPDLPTSAGSIEGFIPYGWFIEMESRGDLNGDKKVDAAIVLQKNSQNNNEESANGAKANDNGKNPRILAIILKNMSDGDIQLVSNDHIFIPINSGKFVGDPLNEITVTKGSLIVNVTFDYAGSPDITNDKYVFRLANGYLRVVGYDGSYTQRRTHDSFDVLIVTKEESQT